MLNTFLIDRFSEPLTNAEASEYFSCFISFDQSDHLIEPKCELLLDFETKILKLFMSFFLNRLPILEVKLEATLSHYLKEKKWIKNALRSQEFVLYKKCAERYTEKNVHHLDAEALSLFVVIGCRDLFFPTFIISGMSIKACDDNVFLVTYENELLAQELKNLVKDLGLHIRAC